MFWGAFVRIKWKDVFIIGIKNSHSNPSNILLGDFFPPWNKNHCRLEKKEKKKTKKQTKKLHWLLELLFPFCHSFNSLCIINLFSDMTLLQKILCFSWKAVQISTGFITPWQYLLISVLFFGSGSQGAWEHLGNSERGYWAHSRKSWSSKAWYLAVCVSQQGFKKKYLFGYTGS